MPQLADIGVIGLAVMGRNLALNIADHGFRVSVFNRTTEKVVDFLAGEADGADIVGTSSLEEFVASLEPPRRMILMIKAGDAVDAQLDTLRLQHERSRELISGISNSLEGYVAGDPMKTSELLENAAAYCALLRHHIHIEDHVFYPMAKKVLTPDEIDMLAQEFEKQKEKAGGDMFERCHKIVVDMGSILSHLK